MKKRWLFLWLIPISVLITIIVKYNPSWAEYYSVNIYPFFVKTFGAFSVKTRISLAEVLIFVSLVAIVIISLLILWLTIKYKSPNYIKKYILGLTSFFSIMYFLFVLFCGINYHRYEFTHYSGLEIIESTKEELIDLCKILIGQANSSRSNLDTEAGTVKLLDGGYHETAERAALAMDKLSEEYQVLKGEFSLAKPIRQSKIMSYLGIAGIYIPFTFEANVNVDMPPYRIPSSMVHELVHLRGFMREDEANFLSYLAGINSGYEDFSYSGTMLALTHAMNALYGVDSNEYARLYNLYSEDVMKDIIYNRDYWRQFESKALTVSYNVNDVYLRVNSQHDGVRSYGRMVDLLLAYYR